MVRLDSFDRNIIYYLARTRVLRTTNKIAFHVGMSWNTAEVHLKRLKKLGFVLMFGKSWIIVEWDY